MGESGIHLLDVQETENLDCNNPALCCGFSKAEKVGPAYLRSSHLINRPQNRRDEISALGGS